MRNHGNYVASLSQLGRWLAEQAEEAGATILPETSGEKLLVTDGRVRGVRTGDRGRGKDGEQLPKFEPGSDLLGQVTVLAEGTQGHLTGAAISRFGLEGENPQVWALGVKEVWKVAKPLDHVIHTMGWPLRGARQVPGVRRLVHLPDGRGHAHDRHGRRPRLPRRRALRPRPAPGAEDAPEDRAKLLARRRAGRVGREDDPRGRLVRAADAAARAGAPAHRRRGRNGQRAGAQGHPLRDRVGDAGGRGDLRRAPAGRGRLAAGRARAVRPGGALGPDRQGPVPRPQHAPGVREGLRRAVRRMAGAATASLGHVPARTRRAASATPIRS